MRYSTSSANYIIVTSALLVFGVFGLVVVIATTDDERRPICIEIRFDMKRAARTHEQRTCASVSECLRGKLIIEHNCLRLVRRVRHRVLRTPKISC